MLEYPNRKYVHCNFPNFYSTYQSQQPNDFQLPFTQVQYQLCMGTYIWHPTTTYLYQCSTRTQKSSNELFKAITRNISWATKECKKCLSYDRNRKVEGNNESWLMSLIYKYLLPCNQVTKTKHINLHKVCLTVDNI